MALFGRKKSGEGTQEASSGAQDVIPIVGTPHFCRICDGDRSFTRSWRRKRAMRQCPCCGMTFEHLGALYGQVQPACPRCEEPLECPGFDYGLCDGCGSKYEIMEGSKPGLLPNRPQREAMEKHGKVWKRHQ